MLTYLIEIRQGEFDHGLQIIFQRHVRIAFRLFNIRRNQAASRILNGRFIVSGYCIRVYAVLSPFRDFDFASMISQKQKKTSGRKSKKFRLI